METLKLPSGVELDEGIANIFLGEEKLAMPRLLELDPKEEAAASARAAQSAVLKHGFTHILMAADRAKDPGEYLIKLQEIARSLRDDFVRRMQRSAQHGAVRSKIERTLPGTDLETTCEVSDDVVLRDLESLRYVVFWAIRQRGIFHGGCAPQTKQLLNGSGFFALYKELAQLFLEIGRAYLANRDNLSEPVRQQIERILQKAYGNCLVGDTQKDNLGRIHARLLHGDAVRTAVVKTLYVDRIGSDYQTRARQSLQRLSGIDLDN